MSRQDERYIADVLSALDTAQRSMCDAGDPNAYFVALYRATTAKCLVLVTAITDSGHPAHAAHRHLDARLIRDIVVCFEPRYARAVAARDANRLARDDPWHRVLDHASTGSPASVLVLGAHTHIGFDLPMVLASDLPGGTPLFDAADARQARTLAALNGLFMDELTAIMANVAEVEAALGARGLDNTGGCARLLRVAAIRALAAQPLRALLSLARTEAHRNAARIRRGALDEARLGARVDARNRRMMSWWRRAGRERRGATPRGTATT